MQLNWFFVYVLPVLTVLAVGQLGTTRRVGFWGALILSVILTPIGGFIVTLISGPKRLRPTSKPKSKATTVRAANGQAES